MLSSAWGKLVLLGILVLAVFLGERNLDVFPGPHAWVIVLTIFVIAFLWRWWRHRAP